MKIFTAGLITVAMLASLTAFAQSGDDAVDLVVGGGLVLSPEYQDFIDDAYDAFGYSDSGGMGWLDLYAGVEMRPAHQVGILLGCDMWINGVDASGGGLLDETYANVIMIPSAYVQLYITENRMFYINGGVNLPLPESGSDYYDFENDGLGVGLNIGIELADVIRLEGGYVHVPVTVKRTGMHPFPGGEKDYDFGGLQARILLAF